MLYISISATLYSLQWAKENERLSIQTERTVPVCSKMHSFLHHRKFSFCTQKEDFFLPILLFIFLLPLNIFLILFSSLLLLLLHQKQTTEHPRWDEYSIFLSLSLTLGQNETNKWIKKRNKINCRGIILFVLWKWKSE